MRPEGQSISSKSAKRFCVRKCGNKEPERFRDSEKRENAPGDQMTPWARMASATRVKPAMLAPST